MSTTDAEHDTGWVHISRIELDGLKAAAAEMREALEKIVVVLRKGIGSPACGTYPALDIAEPLLARTDVGKDWVSPEKFAAVVGDNRRLMAENAEACMELDQARAEAAAAVEQCARIADSYATSDYSNNSYCIALDIRRLELGTAAKALLDELKRLREHEELRGDERIFDELAKLRALRDAADALETLLEQYRPEVLEHWVAGIGSYMIRLRAALDAAKE